MKLDRGTLLRVVLVALGLGALSGVAAMVAPVSGVWRFAGVSVLGAIVAAALMPISRWTDKPETRAGGVLGVCVCVGIFLGGCLLIWESLIGRTAAQFLAAWVFGLLMLGVPAAAMLKMIRTPGWRWASIVAVWGMGLAFVMVLAGGTDLLLRVLRVHDGWKFFSSASVIAFGTVCAAFALVGYPNVGSDGKIQRDRLPLRWIAAPAALLGVSTAVWGIFFGRGGYAWVPVSGLALAACVAHAVLLNRSPTGQRLPWLRVATVGAACLTGGLVVMLSVADSFFWLMGERPAVGAGILAFCGTFAMVIMDRLSSSKRVELREVGGSAGAMQRLGVRAEVRVECPRCAMGQSIAVGAAGALCAGCKLHIAVTVHGAACGRCGYDLSDLKGATCPECGAGVA